ncbi:MAG: RluA family pseudouridine synthase [Proteobacteria bacterium]|nr:RluA family pseudouridine synthase [Pseudomonadota bacterium]MBU1736699.1 RluA family pseudouridine synthase [Pseudomonadota bacterium]
MKKTGSSRTQEKKKKTSDTFIVEQEDPLLACLLAKLPHKSRKTVKAVLRDGQVSIDQRVVTQFDHPLMPGQRVDILWEQPVAAQQTSHGLKIIAEDDDLIIIDKPSGLLTIATEKEKSKTAYAILSDYVKKKDPDNKIFIIHRLDRETSGLLMFARNEEIKHQIQESWETTISLRTYVAVVEGQVEPPEGTITSWLTESKAYIVYSSQNQRRGKKAVTHYRKIRESDTLSLLQVNLETGRKHQIRVHMQDINHPIIGDSKYGATLNPIRRMGLHAQVLAFTHPRTGSLCRFETEIPKSFLLLFGAE